MSDPIEAIFEDGVLKPLSPLNLPEHERVKIIVDSARSDASGEGIQRSAGAWADDAEGLDEYLDQCRRARKLDRPGIEP